MVAAVHTFLRSSHNDEDAGLGCFLTGRSTANQRIEAYWSHLAKDGPGWWINFFKDLRDLGLFIDSDPVHVDCIRFCFMPILRNELYQVAELWNQHRISSSKFGNSSGPRGRPDCMFFLPHLYSTDDYKTDVDEDDVQEFYDHSTLCPPDYSDDFKEFALTVMNEHHLPEPHDVSSALDLYMELLKEILNEIMREQSQDANIEQEAVVLEENQVIQVNDELQGDLGLQAVGAMQAELTQLKAKMTRFKNKLSSNQEQWVQTFKGIQEQNRLFMVNTAVQTEPVVETEDTTVFSGTTEENKYLPLTAKPPSLILSSWQVSAGSSEIKLRATGRK
ncbi:hypothetical protein AWC38_SpisGene19504 [Stylophora pistillata]|uniref:Integrase core domain-containing protein n=1 Tax=Stylophora pistillata TaxID=50429 RepID=A0A2B4RIP5_STYPI|nr:hypothetical protein AWC38_SpisGene19504 [Stylophora pistillata]